MLSNKRRLQKAPRSCKMGTKSIIAEQKGLIRLGEMSWRNRLELAVFVVVFVKLLDSNRIGVLDVNGLIDY